jgi:hypothetical protein
MVLVTMATTIAAFHWWIRASSLPLKTALIGAGFAWWCAAGRVTAGEMRRVRLQGSDYERERWWRSDVIEWGRTAGRGHPLFSNRPPAVYFHLHRAVRDVPTIEDAARMQEFADRVRAEDGRVLMFRPPTSAYVTIDSLRRVTACVPCSRAPAAWCSRQVWDRPRRPILSLILAAPLLGARLPRRSSCGTLHPTVRAPLRALVRRRPLRRSLGGSRRLLLGIVAFALVLEITVPPGPGLDPDALAYMGSAESFAQIGEFRAPTARWWST